MNYSSLIFSVFLLVQLANAFSAEIEDYNGALKISYPNEIPLKEKKLNHGSYRAFEGIVHYPTETVEKYAIEPKLSFNIGIFYKENHIADTIDEYGTYWSTHVQQNNIKTLKTKRMGDNSCWIIAAVPRIDFNGHVSVPEACQDYSHTFVEIGPTGSTADATMKANVANAVSAANALTNSNFPPRSTSPRTYVYGTYIDEPLAMSVGTGASAKTYYFHANHLYSVAALSDSTGAVVERYKYDAMGHRVILAPDGVTTRSVSSYGNQRGFTGYMLDQETGMYFAQARMYSPTLGRFVNRDPMEYVDGSSLYEAYFAPNSVDPMGLSDDQPWKDFVVTIPPPKLPPQFTDPPGGQYYGPAPAGMQPGAVVYVPTSWSNPWVLKPVQYGTQDYNYSMAGYQGHALALEQAVIFAATELAIAKVVAEMAAARTAAAAGECCASNVAHNAAQFERYLEDLRADMSRPFIRNPELAQEVSKIYRPGATIGSGSTADAVRVELAAGIRVGGKCHYQKAQDMITYLQRWIESNPYATAGDRAAAENIVKDLNAALSGK